MNFLAHFHLAWPDQDLVAGGLEGDYHKGPVDASLSDGLQRGVRLHRAIDAYTDSHPALAGLRQEFTPRLRRFAGEWLQRGGPPDRSADVVFLSSSDRGERLGLGPEQ